MTRCANCGVDAGFPIAVCPSCGARSTPARPNRGGPDGRTVLADDATIGPSRESGAAAGCFLVVDGPDKGKQFLITNTGLVGRGTGGGVVLTDPRVSVRHAHLHVNSGRVVYQDLEATNGSFLILGGDRKRLRGPYVVADGDELALGNTVLRYVQLAKGAGR